ncbi:MAG: hypothetical protein ACJAXT_002325 [Paracoccaceae bacterium]|jgi:hypothetical protein
MRILIINNDRMAMGSVACPMWLVRQQIAIMVANAYTYSSVHYWRAAIVPATAITPSLADAITARREANSTPAKG